jgi:hypothetical protein
MQARLPAADQKPCSTGYESPGAPHRQSTCVSPLQKEIVQECHYLGLLLVLGGSVSACTWFAQVVFQP